MIIWLASYPRSGNTMTRTIIKSCLGLDSFDDEAQHIQRILSRESRDMAGYVEMAEPWESFYPKAKASSSVYLIKTHRLPQDDSPAIYVLRDGRSSIWSYLKFLDSFFPESQPSLPKVILGHDYYGGWSDHIKAWEERPSGALLSLRFEQLVNADSAMLENISTFIDFKGNIKPWKNPIEKLHQENPQFYREGKTEWKRPESWTDNVENLFALMHGDCQRRLGYPVSAFGEKIASPDFYRDIADLAKSLIEQNRQLQTVCQERLQLIQTLDLEAKKRLDIIQKMQSPVSL